MIYGVENKHLMQFLDGLYKLILINVEVYVKIEWELYECLEYNVRFNNTSLIQVGALFILYV